MLISVEQKQICQKGKRLSAVFFKSFQISSNYFSFHRHLKGYLHHYLFVEWQLHQNMMTLAKSPGMFLARDMVSQCHKRNKLAFLPTLTRFLVSNGFTENVHLSEPLCVVCTLSSKRFEACGWPVWLSIHASMSNQRNLWNFSFEGQFKKNC